MEPLPDIQATAAQRALAAAAIARSKNRERSGDEGRAFEQTLEQGGHGEPETQDTELAENPIARRLQILARSSRKLPTDEGPHAHVDVFA